MDTAQAEQWRDAIKAALFAGGPPPELEPEFHGQFEPELDVVAERVSYGTQFGMRVPAILYRPRSQAQPAPGLIVINGHGGDKYSWYAFYSGVLYARAGAVVLTYDPTGEGERNNERRSGTRAHDRVEPPDELGRRLGGLMLTDVMQAVSYLSQRAEVDRGRLGAMGYSVGSFVLSVAGAVETRLKACVMAAGGNLDGANGYWDNSKPMCQGMPYKALTFLGDRATVIYALHAMRGPSLLYIGDLDDVGGTRGRFAPYLHDLRGSVTRLLGTSAGILEGTVIPEAGHRPWFVTKAVALWLERHLDLPAWSDSQIRAMPETHISEWARTNNVAMDRGYAMEEREGGTHALGAGVPGLARAELNVYTDGEWALQKDRLVHEAWRREAKARIAPAGQ